MLEKQISKGDVANYGFNAGGAPLSFDFRIAGHSAPMLNRMETCTGWLGLATEAASAAVLLLCVKFLQLLQPAGVSCTAAHFLGHRLLAWFA